MHDGQPTNSGVYPVNTILQDFRAAELRLKMMGDAPKDPGDFNTKGQIRHERVPRGAAAKRQINEGECVSVRVSDFRRLLDIKI